MGREPRGSSIAVPPVELLIYAGIAFELALTLAVIYTAAGNAAIAAALIGLEAWLFVLRLAVALLLLEEARKWWLRHPARANAGFRDGKAPELSSGEGGAIARAQPGLPHESRSVTVRLNTGAPAPESLPSATK